MFDQYQLYSMIATIQCYIHCRKGVEVDVDLVATQSRPDLLLRAFTVAERWLIENAEKENI